MATNMCGKVHTHQDDEVRYSLLQHNRVTIIIQRIFCFGQALERKKEPGQIELD
jgi:hypothetical protein